MVVPPAFTDAGFRTDTGPASRRAENGAGTALAGRRIGMKAQRALSDEQERLRLEGLRILARIIARHVLAHPGLYEGDSDEGEAGPTGSEGQVDAGGPPDRTGEAA